MSDKPANTPPKRPRVVRLKPSYGGCRTCRLRRVKCDEQRPVCQNCIRVGRDCRYATAEFYLRPVGSTDQPSEVPQSDKASPDSTQSSEDLQLLRLPDAKVDALPSSSLAGGYQPSPATSFDGLVGEPSISLESWKHVSTRLRDGFIAECRADANRSPHWSTALLATSDITQPCLALSTTALSLLHVASMQTVVDVRVLHEARRAYGAAIVSVRRALSTTSARKVIPSDLLLGIELLGLYSDPATLSQARTERTWDKHILASAELLRRIGPAAFNVSPTSQMAAVRSLQSVLFVNYKMCLSFRRRINLDLNAVSGLQDGLLRSGEALKAGELLGYIPSFRLPELLQLSDALVRRSSPTDACKIAPVVEKLLYLRESMQRWNSTDNFPEVSRSSAADLDPDIEEHGFLLCRPMFQPWQSFSHWPRGAVGTSMVVWISSLLADCAVLRIMHFRCSGMASWEPTVQAARLNAYNTAIDICRSIQSLSRLDSLKYARSLHLLIAMAGAVFQELGAEEESNWCRDCQFATQARLRRLTPGQPRSLCRIEDVAPALVNGVRFRTRDLPRPEDIIT